MNIYIQSGENFDSLDCGQIKKAQTSDYNDQQLEEFHNNVSEEVAQQEGMDEDQAGRMLMIKSELETFIEELGMKYSQVEVRTAVVDYIDGAKENPTILL